MPRNPSDKSCWKTCPSCFKCENRRRNYGVCGSCSGKHDPYGHYYPDPDDYCDCVNGILRHRTASGRLIVRKFMSNPYAGSVRTDAETQDERDWNSFIAEQRELRHDPTFNPIQIEG